MNNHSGNDETHGESQLPSHGALEVGGERAYTAVKRLMADGLLALASVLRVRPYLGDQRHRNGLMIAYGE